MLQYEVDAEIVENYRYDISSEQNIGGYVITYRLTKDDLWTKSVENHIYTGNAIKPDVKVYNGRTKLVKGKGN